MADVVETNGIKAWIQRALLISDAINKIGLATILVSLFIAAYFGWIANPVGNLPNQLARHDERVSQVFKRQTRVDGELVFILEGLKTELTRINRVQRIRTCSEILDRLLREMCLQ